MPNFKHLKDMHSAYHHEQGESGHRIMALNELENALGKAIREAVLKAARAKAQAVFDLQSRRGAGRTKALVSFFEEEQTKRAASMAANQEVIRLRQWLHRQGAVLDPKGRIIWRQSNAVVMYDRDLQQGFTKVHFVNGMLMDARRRPLDTTRMVTHFSGPGWAIYVMSKEGNLHVASHSVGSRHHSSLLAGRPVAGAGELVVHGGRLAKLSNKSGHYKPGVLQLEQVIMKLRSEGVGVSFEVLYVNDEGQRNLYDSVQAFHDAVSREIGVDFFTEEEVWDQERPRPCPPGSEEEEEDEDLEELFVPEIQTSAEDYANGKQERGYVWEQRYYGDGRWVSKQERGYVLRDDGYGRSYWVRPE